MNRKILFILLGALLFLALLALLWFWLLHRSPAANTNAPSGFATSSDRGAASTTAAGATNTLGATNTQGGTGGISTAGSGIDMTGSGIYTGGSAVYTGSGGSSRISTSSGVTTGAWLGSSASERVFTPSEIADLNTGTVSGTPFISTTPQAAGLGTSGLIIGAAAAGCLAQYVANEASGYLQAQTADRAQVLTLGGPYVAVADLNLSAKQNNSKFKSIEECLVKTIARAAIDQITRSVVNWINSGFNGQPSFVTNFNQYFANVADQAAGEFIKGSALSFLCSPFAPKIKIAIAQSYANRNSGSGATCSLTKVTTNINSFLKGNWGAGGWGGMLQLTGMPTNNPYGAYAYAQIGLDSSIARAQNNAGRNVSPGGFISIQKCDTSKNQTPGKGNCSVTTPGSYIEESLKQSSIKGPVDGLNLAQNINDIINALTNQVMIKAIYGGLAGSLGGITNPLAPAIDQGASAQAKALLASLQASANAAAQYGAVKQGSAQDIQQVQQNYNTLYNCWQTVASSTALSPSQRAEGGQNASSANAKIAQLQAQVDALNADITRANAAIASIQNLQSQVLFAATPEDVTAAANAVQAAAPSLISAADITTAQQNRAALQTQLTATNNAAQTSLTQCRAILNV